MTIVHASAGEALLSHYPADRLYPAVFSAASILAILEGRKTQTRRLVNMRYVDFLGCLTEVDDPTMWGYEDGHGCWHVLGRGHDDRGAYGGRHSIRPAMAPHGEVSKAKPSYLWVRETWSPDHANVYPCIEHVYRADQDAPSKSEYSEHVIGCTFEQGGARRADCLRCAGFRWRSPRFMPKRAARIVLRVERVRVERLASITEEDAKAEGAPFVGHKTYRETFREGWDRLHAKREAASWKRNPWVWVYDFELAGLERRAWSRLRKET